MSECRNETRARRGMRILGAYWALSDDLHAFGEFPEKPCISNALGDMLADLMHFCHRAPDFDFDRYLETGREHFREELEFECEEDPCRCRPV